MADNAGGRVERANATSTRHEDSRNGGDVGNQGRAHGSRGNANPRHREKYAQDEQQKNEVRQKLLSGEYIVVRVDERRDNRSAAWDKFGRVAVKPPAGEEGQKPQLLKYVQCLNPKCGVIKMFSSGRGALADHICSKAHDASNITPPSKEQLMNFEMKLITLFAGDVLPVSLAASRNFQGVIQAAIQMGVDCGPIDVQTLVPHPTTITAHIKEKADAVRSALVAELKDDIEEGLCSATVDGWTDGQRGRKYLGHTVSRIDNNFEMSDNLLFIPHCDAESVTASVIKEAIQSNLATLSLNPETKLHYVSDDGADIVCALKENERLYCMDHCTNLCVKKALSPQLTKIDLYGVEGGKVLSKVETAVRLLKSSRLRKLTALKKNIKVGPKDRLQQTRFKSSIPMMRSVMNNFAEVAAAVHGMGYNTLEGIDVSKIKAVIDLVAPLELLAVRAGNEFMPSHHERVVEVTTSKDCDSNLQAALKKHIREELLILRALKVIQKCKKVVTFIKTTGLNEKIQGGSLKQEVETRWMSILRHLKSFFPPDDSDTKVTQVNEILVSRGKTVLVLSEDALKIMRGLIALLEGFEEAIKKFEADKEPTIQHVIPQFHKLQSTVAAHEDDNPVIARFRTLLRRELKDKFAPNLTMRHKIGLFLWPKFASLRLLTLEERLEVLATVRELCAEQKEILERNQDKNAGPPSPKRRRTQRTASTSDSEAEDEYATLFDEADRMPSKDEVDQYLLLVDSQVKSKDILRWWKGKSQVLPALSRVARMILATPASSAASERQFSVAGRLISSRRNCLSADTVENLMILHDFIKKRGKLPLTV